VTRELGPAPFVLSPTKAGTYISKYYFHMSGKDLLTLSSTQMQEHSKETCI